MFISGLTDEVLWSILRRGCQNLTSLDLSLSPHFLTEFAVLCIGMVCAVYYFSCRIAFLSNTCLVSGKRNFIHLNISSLLLD